ncbi:MAG: hypothetical protein GY862_13940, partial [Gammaproteobacteria bacterium]|nr:hypothetical protein [Gammaproteobacteria bacterium]
VLKDRKKAQQLFDELVFTKNEHLFFRYKVNKGDSWEKISGRLYGHAVYGEFLAGFNPGMHLTPGKRINIPLD